MRLYSHLAAVGALAGIFTAGSAVAQNRYDGTWSVSLMTEQGTCSVGSSWNVDVTDGRIGTAGPFVQFAGFIDPRGKVSLKASHGSSQLVASGTIRGANGSGTWLSASDRCSGQWRAIRASS